MAKSETSMMNKGVGHPGFHRFVLFLLVIACATGCNRSAFSLAPVSGTVTLDGKPLDNGVVSFQPLATNGDNSGPGSSARCDAEGRFTLQTQVVESEPGAVVGEHRVLISSTGPAQAIDDSSDTDAVQQVELVPRRYNLETELTFTVPKQGTDKANFALESK